MLLLLLEGLSISSILMSDCTGFLGVRLALQAGTVTFSSSEDPLLSGGLFTGDVTLCSALVLETADGVVGCVKTFTLAKRDADTADAVVVVVVVVAGVLGDSADAALALCVFHFRMSLVGEESELLASSFFSSSLAAGVDSDDEGAAEEAELVLSKEGEALEPINSDLAEVMIFTLPPRLDKTFVFVGEVLTLPPLMRDTSPCLVSRNCSNLELAEDTDMLLARSTAVLVGSALAAGVAPLEKGGSDAADTGPFTDTASLVGDGESLFSSLSCQPVFFLASANHSGSLLLALSTTFSLWRGEVSGEAFWELVASTRCEAARCTLVANCSSLLMGCSGSVLLRF